MTTPLITCREHMRDAGDWTRTRSALSTLVVLNDYNIDKIKTKILVRENDKEHYKTLHIGYFYGMFKTTNRIFWFFRRQVYMAVMNKYQGQFPLPTYLKTSVSI